MEKRNRVIDWLIKKEAIEKSDRELYTYAVKSIIMLTVPLLIAFAFGAFFGVLKECILVIVPFMVIRKYSGGYHAKYPWLCFIESVLIIGANVWFASVFQNQLLLHILVLGAILCICIFSPIDSENHRLSDSEKKDYKKVVIVMVAVYALVYLLFAVLKFNICLQCIGVGIILVAEMQLPCIINRLTGCFRLIETR